MKSHIRKLSLILCLTIVFSLCLTVMAGERAPRWVDDAYDEDFEYNDVMIGHALKATVPKVFLFYEAEISYRPVEFDSDKLYDDFELLCDEYEGTYSEQEIAEFLIEYMAENISDYLAFGRSEIVDVEGVGTGSGVVISEDGYIATNAHVASLNEQDKLNLYVSSLSENIIDNLVTLVEDIESYGVELSDEMIVALRDILLNAASEDATVRDEEITLQVSFPTADGNTTYDENSISYEAEIVEIGTQEDKEGLTQDTAILKIDAENLVALSLSDAYPEANSQIVSAGFPAVAEEIFNVYGSDASTLSVSIVTGKVARTIDIEGADYKAIEISSTISNGSSGGPSVNKNLQIEGLNTYMSVSDNRYAYMVPAEFVREKTEDYDLVQDDTTKTFMTGLQMLQQDYGKSAVECFEYVKDVQPDTPYIDTLIEIAEKAPKKEFKSSKGSFIDKLLENTTLLIIIGASLVVLIGVVILIIILVKRKRKKKAMAMAYAGAERDIVVNPVPEVQNPPVNPPTGGNPLTPGVVTPPPPTYNEEDNVNAVLGVLQDDISAKVFDPSDVAVNPVSAGVTPPSVNPIPTEVIPPANPVPTEVIPPANPVPTEVIPSANPVPMEVIPPVDSVPTGAIPPVSRLKSTMKKSEPGDKAASEERDFFFNAPSDI